jgi:hypothetical protein
VLARAVVILCGKRFEWADASQLYTLAVCGWIARCVCPGAIRLYLQEISGWKRHEKQVQEIGTLVFLQDLCTLVSCGQNRTQQVKISRPTMIERALGLQLREADSDPMCSLVEIRGLWDESGE